jgi:hypothetical protein
MAFGNRAWGIGDWGLGIGDWVMGIINNINYSTSLNIPGFFW